MEVKLKKQVTEFIIKNLRWIILLLSIIIFWLILEDIFEHEIGRFDNAIYSVVSQHITPITTTIFKFITNLGGVITVLVVTLCILVFIKEKKYGIYVTVNLVVITLINQLLKNIIQRPRPTEFRIIDEVGYSFPSGHSMVSMAFYGFLIYLTYKNVQNKYLKWISCIILSILIILIGISRIYLGVHYASDVIGGFCFSIGYLIIFTKIIKKDS